MPDKHNGLFVCFLSEKKRLIPSEKSGHSEWLCCVLKENLGLASKRREKEVGEEKQYFEKL